MKNTLLLFSALTLAPIFLFSQQEYVAMFKMPGTLNARFEGVLQGKEKLNIDVNWLIFKKFGTAQQVKFQKRPQVGWGIIFYPTKKFYTTVGVSGFTHTESLPEFRQTRETKICVFSEIFWQPKNYEIFWRLEFWKKGHPSYRGWFLKELASDFFAGPQIEKEFYGVRASYQPKIFGKEVSLNFSFGTQEINNWKDNFGLQISAIFRT